MEEAPPESMSSEEQARSDSKSDEAYDPSAPEEAMTADGVPIPPSDIVTDDHSESSSDYESTGKRPNKGSKAKQRKPSPVRPDNLMTRKLRNRCSAPVAPPPPPPPAEIAKPASKPPAAALFKPSARPRTLGLPGRVTAVTNLQAGSSKALPATAVGSDSSSSDDDDDDDV
jgi:hypothetical protein